MAVELPLSTPVRVIDAAPLTIVYGYRYLWWSYVIATLVTIFGAACALWRPQPAADVSQVLFISALVPWIAVIAGNSAFYFWHCRVLRRLTGRVSLLHQLLLLATLMPWLGFWPYQRFSQSVL